ncbi:hypothetical protein BaRGS_00004611 [Batillaria attramentaria]|uniref:Uncharacterized protein n=1 Tax=Batillaria attramentaria TaxID=370345 RepID=A0ABD0LY19_9CAEN
METADGPKRKHSLTNSFLASPPRSRGSDHRPSDVTNRKPGSGQGAKAGGEQTTRHRKTGLSTVYGNTPQYSDDWIFDFDDDPPRKLGVEDIKIELYRRECRHLDVTPVGAYLRSPSSPELSIRHYLLGPRGAKALAVPLLLDSCITTLNLERNALGSEGARHLMEALIESCSITHLNLSYNELGSTGAAILGRVLMNNSLLRSVTLSGNLFKDADADHFVQVLLVRQYFFASEVSSGINDSLDCLDLSWNHIRPKGGVALLNGVKENLDMANNRITNVGLLALASQLKHNDTLQVLKLGDNLATGEGAQALGDAILAAEDCAIHTLDLTNVNVWDSLIKLVQDHAQTRPLKLVHSGKVTRHLVPLPELEQQIKEEIMAATRARDDTDGSPEGQHDGDEGQHGGTEEEANLLVEGDVEATEKEETNVEDEARGEDETTEKDETEDKEGMKDENKTAVNEENRNNITTTETRESTESLEMKTNSDVQSKEDDQEDREDVDLAGDKAESVRSSVTPAADEDQPTEGSDEDEDETPKDETEGGNDKEEPKTDDREDASNSTPTEETLKHVNDTDIDEEKIEDEDDKFLDEERKSAIADDDTGERQTLADT